MGWVQQVSSRAELAHVTDPDLRASYVACKELSARRGRTFFLATLLLPPWKRPYVHALYAFARFADEIVDDLDSTLSHEAKGAHLSAWGERFLIDVRRGDSTDPICRAAVDTVRRWAIPVEHFEAFLHSMRMDLTVSDYKTYDDLMDYVHGSAAVIGRQLVPILEPLDDAAYTYAEDLGIAFQLTNFVRDVGEDLRRGRIYLPLEDLAAFDVDREQLEWGVVDGRVRRLLAFQIARAREVFRAARPGIRLLHATSRDCIDTACTLYGRILDEVERADYQVLDRRVAVGRPRQATVAGRGLLRARRARARQV